MRALIWFLGLCFFAVAAALLAHYNNGAVVVILPFWQVKVSFTLNFLLLALFLIFLFGYGLVRSIAFSLALPARARAWRKTRRQKQGDDALGEALRFLFEGRYGHALRVAESAWQAGRAPDVAALVAARAAQRLRKPEEVKLWLERAESVLPRMVASDMIAAETALEQGDFQSALARLERLHGRHIAALRLELRARQQLGDAEGMLKLLRQLEKRGGMQAEPAAAIRRKAHEMALAQRREDAASLLAYYDALRRNERSPRLTLAVCRHLARLGEEARAARLIEAALAEGEWSSDLAALYGELGTADSTAEVEDALAASRALTARIAAADGWLVRHPEDSRLLLTLGRLCERQKLWGKAQSYLEASLALRPSRETYLTLARLMDTLGDAARANQLFRQAAECDNAS
ncbi:MAG: heme biosynthesis protein HemY [Zoogloeaceae bacterium]|jgi:HemY protein|nr:heme biosynthesis protein HemY [Zoogloeaceae bacterium]